MHVSVINSHGQHDWVEYDPYEEDAAAKEAVLSEWVSALIARLQLPWFVPRLNRVENALRTVTGERS